MRRTGKRTRNLKFKVNEEPNLSETVKQQELKIIEDIAAFAAANPKVAVQVPFSDNDIGGNLLLITSQGLYSDPCDAIREFAQNGVDAGASTIVVRFNGRDVAVQDDGSGMDFVAMVQARQFARSRKSPDKDIGFRGIGIYAGFHLCDTLTIVSQEPGSNKRSTMRFDFGTMRKALDESSSSSLHDTALAELIYNHSILFTETLAPKDVIVKGKTLAILESLTPHAYQQLSDMKNLHEYLRTRLPVPIDDSFPFKSEVDEYLVKTLGYKTVEVRIADEETRVERRVVRSFVSPKRYTKRKDVSAAQPIVKLFRPSFEPVVDSTGNQLAVMWTCMSDRTTLGPDAGIFFKKAGFTIGNGLELRKKFASRPVVFQWYVGEIYVTDSRIKPTAARDWFENTSELQSLMIALDKPTAMLLKLADSHFNRARAKERLEELLKTLPKEFPTALSSKSPVSEMLAMYASLGNVADSLAKLRITKDPELVEARATRDVNLDLVMKERERIGKVLARAEASSKSSQLSVTAEARVSTGPQEPVSPDPVMLVTLTNLADLARSDHDIDSWGVLKAVDDSMRSILDVQTYDRIIAMATSRLQKS